MKAVMNYPLNKTEHATRFKRFVAIGFLGFIALLILLTVYQTNAQTPAADTTHRAKRTYTIEDVYEMHKKEDTVRIGEIIAIKLKAGDPLDSITTLYIDGKAIPQSEPLDKRPLINTVLFTIDKNVQTAIDTYLKKEASYNNLVKVYVSVGNATTIAANAKPLVIRVKHKMEYAWLYISVLSLLFLLLIYYSLTNRILKDDANIYYSLGRTQLFLWTIVFGVCYLYIWFSTYSLPDITTSVLVILGISAGTTAAAKVIENAPAPTPIAGVAATGAAPPPPPVIKKSEGWLLDILSDGNSISVGRFQSVIFNVVFGVIFIQKATSGLVLPEFDTNALLLMGISSGTYAGLKVTEAK